MPTHSQQPSEHTNQSPNLVPRPARVIPAVTVGLAAAVVMWCLWFVAHLPAIRVPKELAGPLLMGVLAVVIERGVTAIPRRRRILAGAGAGLVAGLVNLLLLGSKITEPAGEAAPAPGLEGLRPEAWVIVAGFLLTCTVAGAIAGLIALRMRPERAGESAGWWLSRLAMVSALSIVPLLTIGGLVTSTGSGLAVPDWPGTYGSNMFLYPIGLMADPRVYFEHTHRLFGTLVGLTTMTLLVSTLVIDPRRWVKVVAFGLFVAVCLQGWMGGARVYEKSQYFAVMHGVFAQLFFGGTVAFAAAVSPAFRGSMLKLVGKGPMLSAALLAALLVQLVMGALYRHLGSMHPLWTHVVFSLVVVTLAILTGSWWIKQAKAQRDQPLLARLRFVGIGLHGVVTIQFLLGWVALLVVLTGGGGVQAGQVPTADQIASAPAISPAHALVRTAHQANGALLLALATLGAVWAWRLRQPKA
jgi:hypothetical protein